MYPLSPDFIDTPYVTVYGRRVTSPLAFLQHHPTTEEGEPMSFVGTIVNSTPPADYPKTPYREMELDCGGDCQFTIYIPSSTDLYWDMTADFEYIEGIIVFLQNVFRMEMDNKYVLEYTEVSRIESLGYAN